MTPGAVAAHCGPHGLAVLGHCATEPDDGLPAGTRTLALIGPSGPGFWDVFSTSGEFGDGATDPLNRWSERVIGSIARAAGGTAVYPFGGPPWHPFIGWARRTGQAFASPVGLLVHATHGLFVSYRGAIALPVDWPAETARNPCETCPDQPCRAACPVAALGRGGYDVAQCHARLRTAEGAPCLSGCLVRRACPVGAELRPAQQSAFHMAAFHRIHG